MTGALSMRARIAMRSALDGLRMYWRGAAVTAAAGVGAVGATLIVSAALTIQRGGLVPRLLLSTIRGGDLGLRWNTLLTTTTADTQRQAIASLGGILIAVTIGVLIVAVVTMFAVASARAAQRAVEIQVRRAVGASRRRLWQATLIEGTLVAGLVISIGGLFGGLGAHVALATWPGGRGPSSSGPALLMIGVIAGAIITGALFSLIPARGRTVRETSGKSPALHAIALQLGLSLLVLTMSTLIMRHAATLTSNRPAAAQTGDVLEINNLRGGPAERSAHYAALLDALHDSTRYDVVSLASPGATVGLGTASKLTADCGSCYIAGIQVRWQVVQAVYHFVSADTFRAVGAAVVAGRGIAEGDRWEQPRVAVVNRALAAEHFQHGDAVGRKLQLGEGQEWYTVVGVIDEPARVGFGAVVEPRFAVYLSTLQQPPATADLLMRARGGTAMDPNLLQRTAAALGLPISHLTTTSEATLTSVELAPLAWFGRWIGVEGWAMLLIAITGTFSLMQLWVASLRREIGVRRAVGARRRSIVLLVLWRAALAGVGGVVLALWFGPAAHDALATAIAGLPDWDPSSLVRYAALLVGIALSGALIPAWYASRAEPAALVASTDS